MPYSTEELKTALSRAQAKGDTPAVQAIQAAIAAQPDPATQTTQQRASSDYAAAAQRARAAGDMNAATALDKAAQGAYNAPNMTSYEPPSVYERIKQGAQSEFAKIKSGVQQVMGNDREAAQTEAETPPTLVGKPDWATKVGQTGAMLTGGVPGMGVGAGVTGGVRAGARLLPETAAVTRKIISGAAPWAGDVAAGATQGAMTPGEGSVGMGAALGPVGGAVGRAVGQVAMPFGSLSPESQSLAQRWADRGVPTNTLQVAPEGTFGGFTRRTVSDIPIFGKGPLGTGDTALTDRVTRYLMGRAGMTDAEIAASGGKLTPGSLTGATNRNSQVYENVAGGTRPASMTQDLHTELQRQAAAASPAAASPLLGAAAPTSPVAPYLENIISGAPPGTPITGDAYLAARSHFRDEAARAAAQGDAATARQFGQAKSALDNWAESNLTHGSQLTQANEREYFAKLLSDPSITTPAGDVKYGAFGSAMQRENPMGWLRKDPSEITQLGSDVERLGSTFPQSGTVPRAAGVGTVAAAASAVPGLVGFASGDDVGDRITKAGEYSLFPALAGILSKRPTVGFLPKLLAAVGPTAGRAGSVLAPQEISDQSNLLPDLSSMFNK